MFAPSLLVLLLASAPAALPQEPEEPQRSEQSAQTPPTVVNILVEGEERYSKEQLLVALGQRVGSPLDPIAIDGGLKRLWTSFHVQAEVSYREVEGGIELRLVVSERPSDREPRFIGNNSIDLKTIKRWALLESQTELFVHQAERVRQRIIEGYQREGFYFVEVNIVKRDASALLPDVIFEIREGPKVRVKGVRIVGNDSMPNTSFLLFFKNGISHLARTKLKGPSLFSWYGSPFVRETLEADLLAMRQVYRDRGWLDAVVELKRLDFRDDRSGVILDILVDEGERYTVSKVSIKAVQWTNPDNLRSTELEEVDLIIPEERLLRKCELEAGVPYEKLSVERDRFALRERYGDRGYLSHPSLPRRVNWQFLEPELIFDVDASTVEVVYRIVQGRRLRIREIMFAGSKHTRDRVLRRELSVFPGQFADLNEINRSLARIQATGFFRDDMRRLEHKDPTYKFLPVEDDPSMVDLQFEVDEGRVVDFNVSGGIDSNDGLFGLVSLTMRNFDISDTPSSFWRMFSEIYNKEAFHGAGQLLQLEIAPGTQLSRFRARFLEPDIFRTHLKPISMDLDLFKRLRIYDSHDEDRFEQRIKFGRKFTHDLWGAIGFVNTDIKVDNLDAALDPYPPPFSGPSPIPTLTDQEALGKHSFRGFTLDATLRSLDNVFLPRKGYTLGTNNAVYGGFVGGEYDFYTTGLNGDYYMPAWERDDGLKPTLYTGFDFAVSKGYGDTNEIPYSERYFLGGSRTLRGFEFRGVGPTDPVSGFPLGGETTLSGTVEFQYPLHSVVQPGTYIRRESLRGTLFFDWGVLDEDPFYIDPNEVRASVGFGVGLAFPFPIILNFGFPVREKEGDQKQVVLVQPGLLTGREGLRAGPIRPRAAHGRKRARRSLASRRRRG